MLKLSRPDKPTDFDAKTLAARDAVQSAVNRGKKPSFDENAWRIYKGKFVDTQQGRCAYCERRFSDTGHLEHFRPRSCITELYDDPETWGKEDTGFAFTDRKRKILSDLGYHWLAYAWDNFSASCERCNSAKGNLFPIEDAAARTLPPTEADTAREKPLLLDPYDDGIEPALHLEFDALGAVQARDGSAQGSETVRSLALDRQSFRNSRWDVAKRAFDCIRDLKDGDEAKSRQALEDLLHLGRAEPPANHPGMVRIIVEQELLMTWRELQLLMDVRTP